ncbi:MAG: hypothetical protein R3A79_13130 [Nannocystaceae bacterium]
MEREGMSLTPASGAEARRSRANGRRPRARIIELSQPAEAKSSPEGLVKRRPDDQQVEDLLSPVVPPPPPWGADTADSSPLTALVSEALSPQGDAAIAVGVSVDVDDDDDFDLTPPPAPLADREALDAADEVSAEPDIEEIDDAEFVEVEAASSETSRVAPPPPPSRAVEELEIDLDLEDLSQRREPSKRLLHYLRDRFIDDPDHVDVALAAYRGKYASLVDYAQELVDGEKLAGWLLPYVDVQALARDWLAAGVIWVIDDPGGNGEEPGLHIFLS